MELPKYKFYIAVLQKTSFHKDATHSELYVSAQLPLNKSKQIFLDVEKYTGSDTIRFYDGDNNLLSYIRLWLTNPKIIDVPKNAKYFSLSFKYEENRNWEFAYLLNEVTPHYSSLSLRLSKESNQEFFRQTTDSKISVFGKDYSLVSDSDIETEFLFLIAKLNGKKWHEYFRGAFTKTDCKFDHAKKSCELKLTAKDVYSKIMDGYEKTYDIVKLAPAISQISLYKRPMLQVYIAGADTIANFIAGTYFETDVNDVVESEDELTKKYYFSYLKSMNEFNTTEYENMTEGQFNEFKGCYAGSNLRWDFYNGEYYLKLQAGGESEVGRLYYISLYRSSDDTEIFRSGETPYPTQEIRKGYVESVLDWYLYNVEDIEQGKPVKDQRAIKIEGLVYHVYQRMLCDVESYESGGVKVDTYELPIEDFVSDNRNYKRCIGMKGGSIVCTARSVEETTKFGINDYGRYFTDQFIPAIAGVGRPMPVSRPYWGNSSIWYLYDDLTYPYLDEDARVKYKLKNSYSIAAVIKALLSKIDDSIKHEATEEYSQFLYADNPPIDMARFYVYLTPKSNMLKGDYDQAAQRGEITMKAVMDMLWNCFRCLWFIEDGKLKIEHISYFYNNRSYASLNPSSVQLDFTKTIDLFNGKKADYFQSEVEYEKSNLNANYEFAWMDACTEPFNTATIEVKSNYVQKDKTENITIDQFSPDVDYMLLNPDEFSSDGFALLCPKKEANGELVLPTVYMEGLYDENKNKYDAWLQNGYCSWYYMLDHFHSYDLPAKSIDCNVGYIDDVKGVLRSMTHTIKVPLKHDVDPLLLVKTSLGLGVVDSVSVNIDTRMTTIKLLYVPS